MEQHTLQPFNPDIELYSEQFRADLVSDWMHSPDAAGIYKIAEYVEFECKLPQRFMKLQAPVSDIVKLIADKISAGEQERIYRCSFNLKSLKYSAADDYYLVIADENGMQVARENFQIDIAFAVDDFNFFS